MKPKLIVFAILVFISNTMISQQPQQVISPEFNDDNTITFRLRAPEALQVNLYGTWIDQQPPVVELQKNNNGIWSVTVPKPAPEIYNYLFIVDGVNVMDPSNVLSQRDGARYLSMLFVDGEESAFYAEAKSNKGTISQVWYDSPSFGTKRRMYVYTPYGYENSNQSYPVLYLLHGGGGDEDAWSTMGRARQIMDNLIEQGKAKPMLVVMPNGNSNQVASRDLGLPAEQFDRNDPDFAELSTRFVRSVPSDIIPYIERNYRVIANKENRAISGLSMGGGHTLQITNANPGMFGYIIPMSMGIGENQNIDAELQAIKNAGYNLYWFGCGKDDFALPGALRLVGALEKNGLEHTFFNNTGGHTWTNWRIYLTEFVPLLFR